MKTKSLLLILWLLCSVSALAQSRKQSYDLELMSQTPSPATQETIAPRRRACSGRAVVTAADQRIQSGKGQLPDSDFLRRIRDSSGSTRKR